MNSYFLMSKLKYFHLRPTDLKRSHNLPRGEGEITVQLLLSFSKSVAPWNVTHRSVLSLSLSLFEIQNNADRLILLVSVIAKLSDDAIMKSWALIHCRWIFPHQAQGSVVSVNKCNVCERDSDGNMWLGELSWSRSPFTTCHPHLISNTLKHSRMF